MTSLNHLVVIYDPKKVETLPQAINEDDDTPAEVNKPRGAVTPIKAVTGDQNFACGLNMKKFAGKLYEGAMHGGTDDPQFVNCPHCKKTKAFEKAMAEHERHTRTDKGRYAGIVG